MSTLLERFLDQVKQQDADKQKTDIQYLSELMLDMSNMMRKLGATQIANQKQGSIEQVSKKQMIEQGLQDAKDSILSKMREVIEPGVKLHFSLIQTQVVEPQYRKLFSRPDIYEMIRDYCIENFIGNIEGSDNLGRWILLNSNSHVGHRKETIERLVKSLPSELVRFYFTNEAQVHSDTGMDCNQMTKQVFGTNNQEDVVKFNKSVGTYCDIVGKRYSILTGLDKVLRATIR